MGNIFDSIFMESYTQTRKLLNIKYTIEQGNSSSIEKTKEMTQEVLKMIPHKRNFQIKNNIAISTNDYVENNLPISKLLCCEGLNDCHRISTTKEQHLLIAKINLYRSSSMF